MHQLMCLPLTTCCCRTTRIGAHQYAWGATGYLRRTLVPDNLLPASPQLCDVCSCLTWLPLAPGHSLLTKVRPANGQLPGRPGTPWDAGHGAWRCGCCCSAAHRPAAPLFGQWWGRCMGGDATAPRLVAVMDLCRPHHGQGAQKAHHGRGQHAHLLHE
jgi:hypothetical protein